MAEYREYIFLIFGYFLYSAKRSVNSKTTRKFYLSQKRKERKGLTHTRLPNGLCVNSQ